MSDTMKIWGKVIERTIREETTIGEEQFDFMPGKGSMDAMFALRQRKALHVLFISLEKAYDRVPFQEIWRSIRYNGVPEKYVGIVQDIYERAKTQVRNNIGLTETITVRFEHHQGSALSPFIFDLVNVLSESAREPAPRYMLFDDDIVLRNTNKERFEYKLESWRKTLEDRGIIISRSKTEYMYLPGTGNVTVEIDGNKLQTSNNFKYLGSTVSSDGNLDLEITCIVQAGWSNWGRLSCVLCDRNLSIGVKGEFYKCALRPVMLYGADTWATVKSWCKNMEVAEMNMLHWMCGVSRFEHIKNNFIRGIVQVTELTKKVQEGRLLWYGHIKRRNDNYVAYVSLPPPSLSEDPSRYRRLGSQKIPKVASLENTLLSPSSRHHRVWTSAATSTARQHQPRSPPENKSITTHSPSIMTPFQESGLPISDLVCRQQPRRSDIKEPDNHPRDYQSADLRQHTSRNSIPTQSHSKDTLYLIPHS
ncbi:hypothetical protein PR048_010977 [Dryococelus australis]|uniref:Reverse transcriptase domain-containing protein n=1 Tax=Dryococelus australis TaxID=614101 RepID=A0ABQ9HL00_9NEOP|nr:hypothetical protein PR048_010977 [Dryococelus australis]